MVSSILPKNERSSLTSTECVQDSEFRSFFGRIQDAIICFRDLLTFSILDQHLKNKSRMLLEILVVPTSHMCFGGSVLLSIDLADAQSM